MVTYWLKTAYLASTPVSLCAPSRLLSMFSAISWWS